MRTDVLIAVVLVVALGAWYYFSSVPSGKYDLFAQCLKSKGAVFYGAFWCPHCAEQKQLFGNSVKFLPYVECSTPDGNGQTAACSMAGIQSYPTWDFPDGTRVTGAQTMDYLASKTGCQLSR